MAYNKVKSGLAFLKNKRLFRAQYFEGRSKKTYIMPTGFGIAFGGIGFVLLSMAIGFGNNLLYVFVFLLISMTLSSAWISNKNVQNFDVADVSSGKIFANEENRMEMSIQNLSAKEPVCDIEVSLFKFSQKNQPFERIETIPAGVLAQAASFTWRPERRGLNELPRLRVQSRFPFGLFRAFKSLQVSKAYIVFPERKGSVDLPWDQGADADSELQARLKNQGLFIDFREFQKSDSPKRIDWKRSLKHQKHLLRNFESAGEKRILIDWAMTESIANFEDRISQMALWIDRSQKRQDLYSVRLGKFQTDFSCHPHHYKACMEKLALLKWEDLA